MTVKEELHHLVDGLSDERATEVLEELRELQGAENAPVPEWQKEEILRRKANLQANPNSSVDWDTVKRGILGRNGE